MERLLTIEEAAEIMKVSPKTMHAWLKAGKVKAARIGKGYRIRPADLEAFVQEAVERTQQAIATKTQQSKA
jgi:excisionase family DNA binding protein